MKNRLLVASFALSLALACTPARQVADQYSSPTPKPAVKESLATTQRSPRPTAELTPQTESAKAELPAAPAPVTPKIVPSAQPTPESLPEWAKEAAATAATPTEKQTTTPPAELAPEPDDKLVKLMEEMIAEMEADSGPSELDTVMTSPFPGQVQQIGSVTIEYREPASTEQHDQELAAIASTPAPKRETAAAPAPTARDNTAARADEIMRRLYKQKTARTETAATPATAPATPDRLDEVAADVLAVMPEQGGVGITFMRAGTDSNIVFTTPPAETETARKVMPATSAAEMVLANGREVAFDENRLVEWETAILARRQGLSPRTVLPTWLLQGLEWLTHAPTSEPDRSLTLMPLYRHMEAAGHLSAFNVNSMTDEQVITALRLLVEESKSKKKLRGEALPLPVSKGTPADIQHSFTSTANPMQTVPELAPIHTQEELAQPLPEVQALSSSILAETGTRLPVATMQEPGLPATSLTASTDESVVIVQANRYQGMALAASLGTETQQAFETTAPTDIEKRITRRKAYINKLSRVSVRAAYGFSSARSTMNYELPNLEATVANAANALKNQYAWVPWGQVDVPVGAPQRQRELNKNGQFFISAGLNIPLGFIEVEAGPGRFSQSAFALSDFMPPWEGLDMARTGELMMQRVASPEAKTAMTFRIGSELERLLPEHLLPKIRIGKSMSIGFDVSGYYLTSTDLSYRVGVEILDPQAVPHLEDLFSPIPLISDNTKTQAATAIVSHVESSLPTYFWLPALKGYGLGAKAYINLNHRLRFAARYHYEQTRGVQLEATDWMPRGPIVKTTFLSFGLETQI